MDLCVGVVGVASSRSEERGPCRPRGLVELTLVRVHGDLIVCAARMAM